MNPRPNSLRALATASLLCLALSGCLGDDPAKMLADAQAAFDKRDFNTATIQVKNLLQENAGNAEARFLFGRILLEQGDSAAAVGELRKALEAGYRRERAVPLLIRAMVESGEGKKAVEEFAGFQASDPAEQAAFLAVLGRAQMTLGDRAKAAESFGQSLKLKPDQTDALLGTAALQAMDRDFDSALAIVDKVLTADASNSDALLLKGDLLSYKPAREEAEAAYRAAVKARPDSVRAHHRLVAYLINLNKLDDAAAALAETKKVAARSLQTVYLDSLLALQRKQFPQARDLAAQVLKVAPDHGPSIIVSATAQIRLGQQLQAQTQLEKLLNSNPDSVVTRRLLAESLLAGRNAVRALEVLKPLLAGEVSDPGLLALAGQAYLVAGDSARSTDYFSKLAVLRPDSADVRTRLAAARMSGGDDARAMQDLEAAVKMDDSNVQAEIALISMHIRKGESQKALDVVAELERKQPENALVQNIKGSAMLATKNVPAARAAFEKALSLEPGNIGAATQLVRLDLADKKPEAARKRFEDIIAKEPKNVRAYLLLAALVGETGGSPDEVKSLLEKAVAADPTQIEARLVLVQALLNSRDNKRALEVAQEAQAAAPDNPDVLRLLGRTQLLVGERQQAISTFGKLVAAQPVNPQAYVDLADAQLGNKESGAAEQNLRKALELKPDLSEAQQRLVGLLARANRGDEAIKIAQQIQGQRPTETIGYVLEADVHVLGKQWLAAASALQKAYKLQLSYDERARSAQIVIALYNAQLQMGKKAEAEALVLDWFKSSPRDTNVRVFLAQRAMQEQRYTDAAAQYREILKLLPEQAQQRAFVLNNLAYVAQKQGDARAVEYAEQALKLAPKSADIMETLGTILVERGQTQRGVDLLKQAADAAPTSPEIHFGYAKGLARAADKSAAKKAATEASELAPKDSALKREIDAFTQTL